jgi:hypothetical protein
MRTTHAPHRADRRPSSRLTDATTHNSISRVSPQIDTDPFTLVEVLGVLTSAQDFVSQAVVVSDD